MKDKKEAKRVKVESLRNFCNASGDMIKVGKITTLSNKEFEHLKKHKAVKEVN